MKRKLLFPLLLALTLTGCGILGETPVSAPEPSDTAAETAADTTEAVSETETELESLTNPDLPTEEFSAEDTADAETEPTTEQIGQFAPAMDYEKEAYRFVREELVPVYGLSDTAFFETVDWEQGIAVEPPESTQGIISALIYDLTGDGTPELVVFRSHGYTFIMEGYKVSGDSFDEIGSVEIASYDESLDITPSVTVQGDRILVRQTFAVLPGMSHYGTSFAAYGVVGDSLQILTEVSGYRAPGSVSISVNDDTHYASETEDDLDYDALCEEIRQNLDIEGVTCESVKCGWGDDLGIGYGVEVVCPDEMPVFNVEYVPDSGSFFLDDTGLRERLNIE